VVPWNILSPKVTPRLRQIGLKCLDEDVCDGIERLNEERRVVEVFQAFQFSYETLGDETVCLSRLLRANRLLQAQCVLLPCIDAAAYDDDVVTRLRACHQITHLTLPLEEDPVPLEEDPGAAEESIDAVHEALAPVYEMIEGLKSLKAIHLPHIFCGEDEDDVEARLEACTPVLERLAEACPSLQYVRLCISTWIIRRMANNQDGEFEVEELDDSEWRALEPESFRYSRFASFQSRF